MKVLISGSNGFVGSFLKKNFLKEGHVVVSIGKSSLNDYSIDLENASIDLNNFYDLIIHTAGIVHDNYHANNINIDNIVKDLNITHNFLKSIKTSSFDNFIFLSSVSVYGRKKGYLISENEPLKSFSGYGASKLICEKLFEQVIPKDKLIIFRMPLVIGELPKGNLKKMYDLISENKMILFKGNNAKKSILYIEDLFLIIKNNYKKIFGIYNIKSSDVKFNTIAENKAKELDKKLFYIPVFPIFIFLSILKFFRFHKLIYIFEKITCDLTFDNTHFKNTIKNNVKN